MWDHCSGTCRCILKAAFKQRTLLLDTMGKAKEISQEPKIADWHKSWSSLGAISKCLKPMSVKELYMNTCMNNPVIFMCIRWVYVYGRFLYARMNKIYNCKLLNMYVNNIKFNFNQPLEVEQLVFVPQLRKWRSVWKIIVLRELQAKKG